MSAQPERASRDLLERPDLRHLKNQAKDLLKAIELHEAEIAQWLIDRGAAVNARASTDASGIEGHTPLFHTTVSPFRSAAEIARLLLRNGADPNARATFRKQLRDTGDPEKEQLREYQNVTAMEFARQFQKPQWINEEAIAAIAEHSAPT